MSCNRQHKVAVNHTKYPERSMNLKKHVAYHHKADAVSGNAVPNHHTDRIPTEERYKWREGTVTGRKRRQIVIYRNDNPPKEEKETKSWRIKNEADDERKEGASANLRVQLEWRCGGRSVRPLETWNLLARLPGLRYIHLRTAPSRSTLHAQHTSLHILPHPPLPLLQFTSLHKCWEQPQCPRLQKSAGDIHRVAPY
jgi:hypothetical protein